ncbi:MAG: phosphotransferase [Haliea sp.]|nr:phosphotransferase [Haliea sp.]
MWRTTQPLRTPVTYATRHQGSRFYLVQENLHEDPDVELFTSLDMLSGPSLEQAYLCLDAFARLHARHYGMSASQRDALLPLQYHLFLSPRMGLAARMLNRLALQPCMNKLPGAIPQSVAQAYQRSMDNWDALLAYWFSGPLSLLHGDSHLGNFFVSGDEMGMLDWQARTGARVSATCSISSPIRSPPPRSPRTSRTWWRTTWSAARTTVWRSTWRRPGGISQLQFPALMTIVVPSALAR